MTQIMFETFKVSGMSVAVQPLLALYASGQTSGCVLDSGGAVSQVVALYEGYVLPHTSMRLDLAGQDLTDYMIRILDEQGYAFTTPSDREIISKLKEQLCCIALDYDKDKESQAPTESSERQVQLPDGHLELPDDCLAIIKGERFRCPEMLFQPSLIGMEAGGVHDLIFQAIMKSDVDIHNDLFRHIVLSGGNTMFPGFRERVAKELTALAPSKRRVKVVADSFRKYNVWIGGSILASLPTFNDWISMEEYEESGPAIVHRKCCMLL